METAYLIGLTSPACAVPGVTAVAVLADGTSTSTVSPFWAAISEKSVLTRRGRIAFWRSASAPYFRSLGIAAVRVLLMVLSFRG